MRIQGKVYIPGNAKLSTAILVASSWFGGTRDEAIYARQSDMKRMRIISSLYAGPLISKLRRSELARKRSCVS